MKLFINKGHVTYEANIESHPTVEETVVGGTFGSRSSVERKVVVTHRLDIDIPVGTVLVDTTIEDDPAEVLEIIMAAFQDRVDEYERNR